MTTIRPAAGRRVTAPHRRLRLARTLAAVGVRTALLARAGSPRRGRIQVCGAARVLTALGVRVVVVAPPVAWPRVGGRLAVQGSVGRIGELAVLTAVPRTVSGWSELAEQALLGRPSPPGPGRDDGTVLPVAVRCRPADGEWLDAGAVPRDPAAMLAAGDLVVEVRLLPPLTAG